MEASFLGSISSWSLNLRGNQISFAFAAFGRRKGGIAQVSLDVAWYERKVELRAVVASFAYARASKHRITVIHKSSRKWITVLFQTCNIEIMMFWPLRVCCCGDNRTHKAIVLCKFNEHASLPSPYSLRTSLKWVLYTWDVDMFCEKQEHTTIFFSSRSKIYLSFPTFYDQNRMKCDRYLLSPSPTWRQIFQMNVLFMHVR